MNIKPDNDLILKHKEFGGKLLDIAQHAESIAITTHINSDGDGMVVCFALQEILRSNGINSIIVTDGENLDRYSFLMQNNAIEPYHKDMVFDFCCVIDCNSYDRLGERRTLAEKAQKVAVLDHHVVEHNPIEADIDLIDYSYPSAGALLWRVLAAHISKLNSATRKYVAECVYVSILNDSNNFSNANTNARMFEISADVAKEGIQPHLLHMAYLQNHSPQEMLYVGKSLATITLHHQDKYLFLYSDLAMAKEIGINPADFMSVTRWVQGITNLNAIAYFREVAPGEWKVSLRSLVLNVQEIAARHGGGGHRKASGLTLHGNLQQVQHTVLDELETAHLIS
ncbi:MAG: DHH family phosphoesterase [Candidatus Cloacimonetes bacterium]|nr:DHH family phosphoesterase [Candidatus Cloacimonadota bacterium]